MHLAFKVIVTAVSVLLSLLVGEAYVRLFRSELVDSTRLRARLNEGSIAHLIRPTTSPDLIYELIPNLSTRLLASQIVTGPEGYRIDPDAVPHAGHGPASRLAFLGDSSSFGWGVEYRQSYPELFRTQIEAHLGSSVEMRNYSVPGYNAEQELAAFQQRVTPYQPDLLVLHHDPNDSEPVGYGFSMSPDYLAAGYGDNALHSSLLKLVRRELRIRENQRVFTYDKDASLIAGAIASGKLYDRHLQALASLASTAKRLNLPVVVILFNGRAVIDDHYEDSEVYRVLHRDLQQRLEGMGFFVLDLFPFYQERMRESGWKDLKPIWRAEGDAHPNPAGHRMTAGALTSYVLSRPELTSRLVK